MCIVFKYMNRINICRRELFELNGVHFRVADYNINASMDILHSILALYKLHKRSFGPYCSPTYWNWNPIIIGSSVLDKIFNCNFEIDSYRTVCAIQYAFNDGKCAVCTVQL